MIFIDEPKIVRSIIYCTKKGSGSLFNLSFAKRLYGEILLNVICTDGLWVLLITKLYENNGLWYRSVGFTNDWKILIFWSVV